MQKWRLDVSTSSFGTERSDHFGGEKAFSGKTVHTVHSGFLLFIFIVLSGEHSVNTLLFTLAGVQVKKDRQCRSEIGYVAVGSSHFGSQSALLSSLSVRLVCMP